MTFCRAVTASGTEKVRGKAHQVCINPVSDAIVSDEWQEPPDVSGDANSAATTSISKDTAISAKLELLVNESRVVTADVVTLTTAAFDEKLPVAPKGAIEPRLCADLPAMCGSEPVVSDIAVVVSFRLRQ